ncbi:HesA/MoeB/ThiF family protein [Hydrotalea sp.]|uniref:HesA/MoeB/ThiF family protein n=1 Tax=Hydrotalea sp. TaxID=2881279 RepID=UPI00258740DD|nr:HesA/MoeB/ThiF family protein [Hydrotalea sp.]
MFEQKRYSRQMILPGFGLAAQQKLYQAKILIVGIGALGCPALQYLVGAGVGEIGIIDGDTIQLHNLHRQTLFNTSEVGEKKVTVAAAKMQALNPETHITVYPFHINNHNALQILTGYDIVIDATDNFSAKYMLNDACALLNIPLIYGAVSVYEGQLTVFNYTKNNGRDIQYRDVFPVPPAADEIKSCEEAGVLGMLPGMIGTMQATEAVKLITGLGRLLDGRLFTYHVLNAVVYEIELLKKKALTAIDRSTFEAMDYELHCATETAIPEISIPEFKKRQKKNQFFVIDVREYHEYPTIDFADLHVPASELSAFNNELPGNKDICVICQHGIRSVYAAAQLQQHTQQKVYSLKGGLTAYFNQ